MSFSFILEAIFITMFMYVYIHEKKWMRKKFYSSTTYYLFLFVTFVHCSHISLMGDNDNSNNVFSVKSSTMTLPKCTKNQ